jgi:hypothetical protein
MMPIVRQVSIEIIVFGQPNNASAGLLLNLLIAEKVCSLSTSSSIVSIIQTVLCQDVMSQRRFAIRDDEFLWKLFSAHLRLLLCTCH